MSNLKHARDAEGPINCNIKKHFQGQEYTAWCERCGLSAVQGPCPFFYHDGTPKVVSKPRTIETLLTMMRSSGWMVAVHNDYYQDECLYTFWLFTHPSGRYVKGEGEDDVTALEECCAKR